MRDNEKGTRTLRQKAKRIEQTVNRLTVLFGRKPTEAETAEMLGMTLSQYQSLLAELWALDIVSLDDTDSKEAFPKRSSQSRS